MSTPGNTANKTSVPSSGYIGLRNTPRGYGVVAVILHWLVALAVIGLFSLGMWMTGLGYYDEWYKRGPELHKSIGIVLFMVMLARVAWSAMNIKPDDEPCSTAWQRRAAHGMHRLLYVLLYVLMISGYLISTADGRAIEIFGLFPVPAVITGIANMEDVAGEVHWYLALLLISLTGVHALAALKHHFIDRDRTLIKMLGMWSRK